MRLNPNEILRFLVTGPAPERWKSSDDFLLSQSFHCPWERAALVIQMATNWSTLEPGKLQSRETQAFVGGTQKLSIRKRITLFFFSPSKLQLFLLIYLFLKSYTQPSEAQGWCAISLETELSHLKCTEHNEKPSSNWSNYSCYFAWNCFCIPDESSSLCSYSKDVRPTLANDIS